MDAGQVGSLIFMVVLVVLSAYFSATETAFSSLNRARVKSRAEEGDAGSVLVLRLSEQYDKLLSTILIGNNIVNITLASVATVFFVRCIGQEGGPTVSTVVTTLIVLTFGEITPKSLAKEMPESFAHFSAPLLRVLMAVFTPVSFVFSKWKQWLSRLFSVKEASGVTEDELRIMVEEAEHGGGINEEESQLICSAIGFNDRTARDILVPRVDVEAVELTDSKEEIERVFRETQYSRLPVYDGTIDHIVGILLEKDFYASLYHTDTPTGQLLQSAVFVPESVKIGSLLRLLQKNKSHMAVVTDEYGGTVGIVTMEDILEELVGEIWDEHDEVVEEIRPDGEDRYRVLCSVGLDHLMEFFGLRQGAEEEASTVNGWVMEQLGKIPEPGDAFTYDRLRVTVLRAAERRAEELEITLRPEPGETSAPSEMPDA